MGFHATRSQKMSSRKTNHMAVIIKNLFLILVILMVSGCVPSINNVAQPDSQATQEVTTPQTNNLADTTPIVPDTGSNTPIGATATTTAAPIVFPTSTELPSFTLTFQVYADAFVKQSEPQTNFGKRASLQVDSGSDVDESLIQFQLADLSGKIQSASLRLYASKNGSQDGPALYTSDDSWSERDVTWANRPSRSGEALDNKEEINTESWVEYNVTSAIQGNGTFNFVLAADSDDAITFSSREGIHPPELAVTFIPDAIVNTAPVASTEDVTLVGAGDISSCKNDNDELTAELIENIPGTVFTIGDNAYDDGEYRQFIDCYDPTWGRFKDRTFPILGNHDYHTPDAAGYFEYFENVDSYYAYNLASWRVYALNSEIEVSENSPQLKWLQIDLATHPSQCVLAYWHEPRWSSGTTHGNSKGKQALWQTLYEAGAELVLNGHEHIYERFMPMDAEGQADPLGMREIIVGTGGEELYPIGTPLPTSEVRNNTTYGVIKLTLHPNSYDWEFIPVAGSTFRDSGSTPCH